jgi:hypothetical protein
MSSGFVSGGTVDNPTERDDEWRQAQKELEAARKAKADLAAQHDGKSLFEVLQANKDKKQAEFEERARYKLHVSLNDEEADYLDAIEEKKRKQEAEVRKDTREQLDAFRRQQEEAEQKKLEVESKDAPAEDIAQWAAPGRKRKKGHETSLLKGVKLRKPSSAPEEKDVKTAQQKDEKPNAPAKISVQPAISLSRNSAAAPSAKPSNALSLGLSYASSEED